ncbi:MAG: aminotransferase class V-fold PLP-dependent enzyme [Phycisphaerales bacterium]|nr:aminotransferase class V-fold PLP-dependent enzyme [Phycisphaerales bacterium]
MPPYPPGVSTLPAPSPLARHWGLDPEVVYLNHGSFGACPRAVLEAQSALRARVERDAVRFYAMDYDGLMDGAREAAGAFVGARAGDIVPVPNATTGVAAVVASFPLEDGDEVLVTDHEYPGCMNNLRHVAAQRGAKIVSVPVEFPVSGAGDAAERLVAAVTPGTRLCLVSHITAPSALVLPVARIAEELERRGVAVLIDGAHAIGQVPVDLAAIGASYYTANFHKWPCAPKGAGMLWARRDRQAGLRPRVLSNYAESGKPGRSLFNAEFDYVGTNDVTAWLCVPDTLRAVAEIGGGAAGWDAVREHNHSLALAGRDIVCRALGVPPPAPDSMLGSMATIPLPGRPSQGGPDPLGRALLERHRIQVPIWQANGVRTTRLSAQLYNSREQYEYLAGALVEELKREGLR